MSRRYGVAVLVASERGRFLAVPRRDGRLAYAGGKVEDGEEIVDAAVRELREETGLVAHANHLAPLFCRDVEEGWTCAYFLLDSLVAETQLSGDCGPCSWRWGAEIAAASPWRGDDADAFQLAAWFFAGRGWKPAPFTPEHDPVYFAPGAIDVDPAVVAGLPWARRLEARSEAFVAARPGVEYVYGRGSGRRSYFSQEWSPAVGRLAAVLRAAGLGEYDLCFANRYDDEHEALGWHADDSPEIDQGHPIAVVSFGQAREIWTRPRGSDETSRRMLEAGSVFIMPAGYQQTHLHRIPRGDRKMGQRISLTFRKAAHV